MIGIKRISEHPEYRVLCKTVYEESFPACERWDFDLLLEREKKYAFNLYAITDDDKPIGIYVPWVFDSFLYIEFLAIDKSFRGNDYGSKFLKFILDSESKNIIVEVEPEKVSAMAKKRIEWYERFGFIMSHEKYAMISLEDLNNLKFIDMRIMTTKSITKSEFEYIKTTLYQNVYRLSYK